MNDPKACTPEHLKRLAEPFFSQGEGRVFVARCCGWVYVGNRPADLCKHCKKVPTNHECVSIEAAQKHADP